jgi:hypothetical protein
VPDRPPYRRKTRSYDHFARRRPFLLNILAACDVIDAERSRVRVRKLMLLTPLVKPYPCEKETNAARLQAVADAFPASPERLSDEDLSIVRLAERS